MILALLAQVAETMDPAAVANDIISPWTGALSLVLPLVLSLFVTPESSRRAKWMITVIGTVVVVGVSLVLDPPEVTNFEILMTRLTVAIGVSKAAYATLDALVGQVKPKGINDLFPTGITIGAAADLADDVSDAVDDVRDQIADIQRRLAERGQ